MVNRRAGTILPLSFSGVLDMSNTTNYIKTAKGYSFIRLDDSTMFYCEKLDLCAFFKTYSDYMIDAGNQDEMIYAGEVVESY